MVLSQSSKCLFCLYYLYMSYVLMGIVSHSRVIGDGLGMFTTASVSTEDHLETQNTCSSLFLCTLVLTELIQPPGEQNQRKEM